MIIRTDLALESISGIPDRKNIQEHHRGKYFSITEIIIPDDETGKPFGKPRGRYITLEGEALSGFSAHYPEMAGELAGELRALIPEQGSILTAGLGNQHITPDALGFHVTEKILATRHLQKELSQDDEHFLKHLRPVSVIAGGVLGQTGIESAEFIKAVADFVKPSAVIVIDALACTELSRLGTTIQLCDSGIAPGSGVGNHRTALDEKTFGIPVIGIGVPTVINMQYLNENAPSMMVTPRDVDRLVTQASHLLGCGINMALHPDMNYQDIALF